MCQTEQRRSGGPQQAFFTAVKMPLLIFLTCGGNALLNGLLAQVLGTAGRVVAFGAH